MALDIGRVRTGLAVSDAGGRVALPLTVIPTVELLGSGGQGRSAGGGAGSGGTGGGVKSVGASGGSAKFRRLLEDYEVDKLLVGLPVSLDGAEHAQAAWVREVAAGIAGLYGLPVGFADERLSSGQAKTVLRSMGYTEKQMRGKLDKTAASIFLQSHLDWLVGQAGGGKGGWDADQGSGQGSGWGSGQVPGPAVGHVTGQAGGGKGGWDADQGSGQAEMTIRTR